MVAAPNADRGAIVKAYVVLRAGLDGSRDLTEPLKEHCKSVTAPYKYPREIVYRKELAKSESGKIRRIELRAEAEKP